MGGEPANVVNPQRFWTEGRLEKGSTIMLKGRFFGTILRVSLPDGSLTTSILSDGFAPRYIDGRGIPARLCVVKIHLMSIHFLLKTISLRI